VLARLRVGTHAPEQSGRVPVNVALVVDSSGSMEGRAIADAIAASSAMIDALTLGDRLAVVVFHSTAEVLVPSTVLDEDTRAEAKRRLAEVRARGTTEMAGGLRAGIGQVGGHHDPAGINRVVLLGDGVPNDEAPIRALAQEAGARGISITSLGLGLEYDETLMGAVAQLSGGRFRYVERSDQVASFFEEEVLRLHAVYAKNATIELTPGPGVRVVGVVGRATSPSGSKVHVQLGDLSRDDARDLIVRLQSDPRREGASVELLDAVLRYEDPLAGGKQVERRVFVGARATASEVDFESGRDRDIEDAAVLTETAAATIEALEKSKRGDKDASDRLERAAQAADAQASQSGNAELRKAAGSLRNLQRNLPAPSPPAQGGPAPKSPVVTPSPPAGASHVVRSAHDEAMQRLH
jgi:Ca-activated chloride channel family protein